MNGFFPHDRDRFAFFGSARVRQRRLRVRSGRRGGGLGGDRHPARSHPPRYPPRAHGHRRRAARGGWGAGEQEGGAANPGSPDRGGGDRRARPPHAAPRAGPGHLGRGERTVPGTRAQPVPGVLRVRLHPRAGMRAAGVRRSDPEAPTGRRELAGPSRTRRRGRPDSGGVPLGSPRLSRRLRGRNCGPSPRTHGGAGLGARPGRASDARWPAGKSAASGASTSPEPQSTARRATSSRLPPRSGSLPARAGRAPGSRRRQRTRRRRR